MQLDEFTELVYGEERPSSLRLGQWAIICLREHRPDLAEIVEGNSQLDSFNVDRRLPALFYWLQGRW